MKYRSKPIRVLEEVKCHAIVNPNVSKENDRARASELHSRIGSDTNGPSIVKIQDDIEKTDTDHS